MFYILSKILWFCLQPSSLIAGALLLGVAAATRGSLQGAKRGLVAGTAGLIIGGLSPIGDWLIAPLENRFARVELGNRPVHGIIVLGGAEDPRLSASRDVMSLNEAAERITEAVALARRFPEAKIVFSGGSDALITSKPPEAETAGKLLVALGIDKSRLVLESKSRNTHENAIFTRPLIAPEPGERWLLVTTAWHMPRSIGCFRHAGLEVEPWPVDYRTTAEFEILKLYSSIPEGLRRLDFISKEYVGLLAYWLTGRTSALLPGP
jgi:uncharacterized SAM-binding protein YcdF (DUF218 family)